MWERNDLIFLIREMEQVSTISQRFWGEIKAVILKLTYLDFFFSTFQTVIRSDSHIPLQTRIIIALLCNVNYAHISQGAWDTCGYTHCLAVTQHGLQPTNIHCESRGTKIKLSEFFFSEYGKKERQEMK